jgi:hypothetical protein
MLNRKCSDCLFSAFVSDERGKKTECRFNPPKAHVIHFPIQALGGPQLNIQVMSIFPQVDPEAAWCGMFEPDVDPVMGALKS